MKIKSMFLSVTMVFTLLSSQALFATETAAPAEKTKETPNAMHEDMKKKREEADQKIKASCADEIAKANCGEKEMGHGLMMCLKEYKKSNKDFKFSEACKTTTKAIHQEMKSMRKMHKGHMRDKEEPKEKE